MCNILKTLSKTVFYSNMEDTLGDIAGKWNTLNINNSETKEKQGLNK